MNLFLISYPSLIIGYSLLLQLGKKHPNFFGILGF